MDNNSFNADNLQVMIQFNGSTTTWSPQPTFNRTLDGNLLGTLRVSDNDYKLVISTLRILKLSTWSWNTSFVIYAFIYVYYLIRH